MVYLSQSVATERGCISSEGIRDVRIPAFMWACRRGQGSPYVAENFDAL